MTPGTDRGLPAALGEMHAATEDFMDVMNLESNVMQIGDAVAASRSMKRLVGGWGAAAHSAGTIAAPPGIAVRQTESPRYGV